MDKENISRVHDDLLWLGDSIICIDNDLIHKVTGLSNKGSNPMNIKNVREIVETNLNTHFDGKDDGVRLISKILGYKFNHGSRIDIVPIGFLHAAYLAVRGEDVNLCDIIRTQLLDNISKIKKTKSTVFRFESLLTQSFFYVAKKFPGITNWDASECAMQTITHAYRARLEIVRDNDIDRIMEYFQDKMKERYMIPPVLVEKYKDELCFMVETDFACMDAVVPRVKFIEPMGYEMSDELIKGYTQIILHSKFDSECPRWEAYTKK